MEVSPCEIKVNFVSFDQKKSSVEMKQTPVVDLRI